MLKFAFLGLIFTLIAVMIILAPKGLIKRIIKYANEDSEFFNLLMIAISIFGFGILLIFILLCQI